MTTSSHSPSASSPVELESVTCWPLIIGTVSFVAVGVVLVGGFAAWSALHPPSQPAASVEVAAEPEAAPRLEEPVELPAAPVVGNENDRVVKVRREVIQRGYTPLPQPRQRAADPAPPLPPAIKVMPPPDLITPVYLASKQRPEDSWLQGLKKEETDRKPLGLNPADDLGANRMKKIGGEPFPLTRAIRDLLRCGSDSGEDRPMQDKQD